MRLKDPWQSASWMSASPCYNRSLWKNNYPGPRYGNDTHRISRIEPEEWPGNLHRQTTPNLYQQVIRQSVFSSLRSVPIHPAATPSPAPPNVRPLRQILWDRTPTKFTQTEKKLTAPLDPECSIEYQLYCYFSILSIHFHGGGKYDQRIARKSYPGRKFVRR